MRKIDDKELKSIQLKILKNIAEFCEQNGLRYCLLYGTLIGAIRHKGYIPWDDDIDIGMPRNDYEYFVKHFCAEHYTILDYSLDDSYPYSFGKVIDTNTVLIEPSIFSYGKMGVYVDVFAVDGLPAEEKGRIRHAKTANRIDHLRILKSVSFKYPVGLKRKIAHAAIKCVLLPIPMKVLLDIETKHARKYDFNTSNYVAILTVRHVHSNGIIKRSYFENLIDVDFENEKFKAPRDYDEYLRIIYGDYLTLPPKDQQTTHHYFEAYYK